MKLKLLIGLMLLQSVMYSSERRQIVADGKQNNVEVLLNFIASMRQTPKALYVYQGENEQWFEITVNRTDSGLHIISKPKQIEQPTSDNNSEVAAFIWHIQQELQDREVIYWPLEDSVKGKMEVVSTSYGGYLTRVVDETGRLMSLK